MELSRVFPVVEDELKNGLKVRLAPSDAVPSVSVATFFHVGSRDEVPGRTGLSHLLEHMMFNGTRRHGPGVFDKKIESLGGSSNAYTSQDLTVYHEDVAASALPTVLELEADRMVNLALKPKVFTNERDVVLEERLLDVDNDLSGCLYEELMALMYRAHPYRNPIIGWRSDIEGLQRDDLAEHYGRYYAPGNATLYVAGDFDPKPTLKQIQKLYGKLPRREKPARRLPREPAQGGERRAVVKKPAQAARLLIAHHAPDARDDDSLALDLVQYALGVGQSGRLFQQLIHGEALATSVMVDFSWRLDPAAFIVEVDLKPGVEPERVEALVAAQLRRVVDEGLPERELTKARNNLRSSLLRELATTSGRCHAFGHYEAYLGDWREGLRLPDRYLAVPADQVRAAAGKYLIPENRSTVVLVPEASA